MTVRELLGQRVIPLESHRPLYESSSRRVAKGQIRDTAHPHLSLQNRLSFLDWQSIAQVLVVGRLSNLCRVSREWRKRRDEIYEPIASTGWSLTRFFANNSKTKSRTRKSAIACFDRKVISHLMSGVPTLWYHPAPRYHT